ncbi:alpha/beta hydrolase fold family protein [Mycolicibacterium hassiacum DSM 44199]|jgi:pimeloyl-ACP methyl ester carboxylesterase|uniref:Alpha/beta hydrolase fold family protein n=1 Tax=Mycolicibacterium hassiacum (strain DSM 44199 / CIP 105218 / JCM 12690 / 3849) TaxID=1122247 RepID=K5BJ83_MYCHD|nr:alpha/beta hydrolase [Mycolicibacterium hassiacum]EKF22664.1 alpha/beta hydrolase fold family protein [Mycolicibacterium hassiacum DSM 44199]MBX5487745.1 alpha/beta hydrolase [Mycolicibacterium hassiacum]MDA4088837.1 alpha/beta hydrolase [Mycolicibacterium hassiacum DSM 44199]VCT91566.1 Haloalkane dehalogenase [Mycolicibacterium hassiacum DSM 44199]
MSTEPPVIPGVRRSFVDANGVRFHVTEAGPADGRPVLALHGWPQHHYLWRDLLTEPPAGLRIIAPDLPGYGWSGPAPHRWAKDDVATDVLALMDTLDLDRVLLVGHDWGAFIGYRMVLRCPERFDGYVCANMAHPWVRPETMAPHLWRFWYQVPVATAGAWLLRNTKALNRLFRGASDLSPAEARVFVDRFRDPVCARASRDTYRTFLTRELPAATRQSPPPRVTVPIRAVFGYRDRALHPDMVSAETAKADDYTVEFVDATHFVVDERPEIIRAKLVELAEQTAAA